MPAFTLDEVREATGAQLYKMEHEEFTDIVTDTRKITPGVLFLAFKGERFNGEDFVRDAVEKGASGVMVSTGCPKEQLAGLKTTVLIVPDTLAAYQQLAHAWRMRFSLPVVVKAASQGSSIGVYIVETKGALADALKEAFSYNDEVLIEEFIRGKELTVAVWGNEEKKEAFPIIEITTASGRYDYESKYTKGASTHIIPARVSDEKTKEIQALAIKTFTACGCKGVARVDMMLSEDGTPYVIEVNSVPGMTELSLVPDAGRAMGVEFPELCERILEMAGFQK